MIGVIALVVAVFGALVFLHELGHFLAARRNGIEVEEFGFGFPPRLAGIKRGRTLYSINWIPLGGFVRMKGEDQNDRSSGSFGAASFVAKLKVLLAGVGMNALAAYLLLLGLAAAGLPTVIAQEFSLHANGHQTAPYVLAAVVAPDSPAAKAGIKRGEVIASADGQAFASEQDLIDFTKAHAGQSVDFQVGHGTASVTLRDAAEGKEKGYLGVTPVASSTISYGWQAPWAALELLAKMMWGTLVGFVSVIVGLIGQAKVSEGVVGPVGVVGIFGSVLAFGAGYLVFLIASVSVSLAVINALPIPALDGGRLALIVGQRVSGRKMSPQLEARIHTIGFTLLLLLMAVITIFDIRRMG